MRADVAMYEQRQGKRLSPQTRKENQGNRTSGPLSKLHCFPATMDGVS
jgi:hypothetical protein